MTQLKGIKKQNSSVVMELQDGVPYSPQFDDLYFSRNGGVAETKHVFLSGNNLPGAWEGKNTFFVGETGFGTGLNFLVTLEAWRDSCAPGMFHYYSMEKFPIHPQELELFYSNKKNDFIENDVKTLLRQYKTCQPPGNKLVFEEGRVKLHLLFMDADDAICFMKHKNLKMNAWYLDGFAPAKNPEMWSAGLLQNIAHASESGASFATYTVARGVKDNLLAAGFTIEKAPGFGKKREMLKGVLK